MKRTGPVRNQRRKNYVMGITTLKNSIRHGHLYTPGKIYKNNNNKKRIPQSEVFLKRVEVGDVFNFGKLFYIKKFINSQTLILPEKGSFSIIERKSIINNTRQKEFLERAYVRYK